MKNGAAGDEGEIDLFVRLGHSLVDGAAFRLASSGATRLIILLLRRFNGHNNGAISCSIREAADWCHCGKSTAAKLFEELETLNLIGVVHKGAFSIKAGDDKNAATTWRLTFLQDQPQQTTSASRRANAHARPR